MAWWPAVKWFRENQVDALQTLSWRCTGQGQEVVHFLKVSAFSTSLTLSPAGINSHIFFRAEIGRSLRIFSLKDLWKKLSEGAVWRLVPLYSPWHLSHRFSKEKFLNPSPNLEGIGYAAQGWFDMVCAQKGSISDVFRLTATGHLAEVYKQVPLHTLLTPRSV